MLKKLLIIFLILLIAASAIGYHFYKKIFDPNVYSELKSQHVLIPTGSSYKYVLDSIIVDAESFDWVAKKMNYIKDKVPPGKYKIEPSWSNIELIRKLRSGTQDPVQLTFNNIRLPEELASTVSAYIEADSTEIMAILKDSSYLSSLGFNSHNILTMFIPNTYEVYWNTSAKSFLERMKKEFDSFWNTTRIAKAEKMGMTAQEINILASIVQKESLKAIEKPMIAGVYYNRLQKGIKLQADPTVVFATREFDLRRVLNRHLEYDSPYNTYIYEGLPPGPICIPEISTIDAVLDYKKHDYIFFCAKPGYEGLHVFAKTLAGHNRNANKYRTWLNQNQIR